MSKNINKRHSAYSFGEKLDISWENGEVEFMRFASEGSSHKHDNQEVALLLSGSGEVVVGDKSVSVNKTGEQVKIPANTPHHMIPSDGSEMVMLIYYAEADQLAECNTEMIRS